MAILVASIDFGTTFSSWACSFKHEFEQDPLKITAKAWNSGTNISQKPDGKTLDEFGYEAESKYAELAAEGEHKSWFFFRRFKMQLFENKTAGKHLIIEDETGKQLEAMVVFSLAIEFLKNDMIKNSEDKIVGKIEEKDIQWVITVPAIWTETSKQFMREAARKAGIPFGHLSLALEPEAVSIYCRHLPVQKDTAASNSISTFKPGTCYLICDAGGGTIDITIHEVLEGYKLREVEKASGGDWGGTKVDKEFENLMVELAGGNVFSVWKENHTDDYLEFMRRFEIKKRNLSKETSKVVLSLPMSLNEMVKINRQVTLKEAIAQSKYNKTIALDMDKLKIDGNILRSVFNNTIEKVVAHVRKLLQSHRQVSHILLAGGFSESQLLQEAIKQRFPDKTIIVPTDAGLAVLKGAVIHGHNKMMISARKAKYTYGVQWSPPFNQDIHSSDRCITEGPYIGRVRGCFDKLIEVNQDVTADKVSATKKYARAPGAKDMTIKLFCCEHANPTYVDDSGCFHIGSLEVIDADDENGVVTSLFLGGTELRVTAVDSSGKELSATFELPD